jgi:hypothetical protein
MITLMRSIVIALCVGTAAAAAPPPELSGNDLLAICAADDPTHVAECQFFIFGVWEGIELGRETASNPRAFCLPDGIDAKMMTVEVKKLMPFLGKKLLQLPAVGTVGAVFTNAYPCKNSN